MGRSRDLSACARRESYNPAAENFARDRGSYQKEQKRRRKECNACISFFYNIYYFVQQTRIFVSLFFCQCPTQSNGFD